MPEIKLNDRELLQLIDKEKLSQADAARRLGVSRQRVSQRLIELRGRTTRAIVCKKLEAVIDDRIDVQQQLKKANVRVNEMCDLLWRWMNGEPEALRVLESQTKRVVHGEGEAADEVVEIRMKDPRELFLRCLSEIREQAMAQMKVYDSIYNFKQAAEFQHEIIEAIGEVEPSVRQRIIDRLNKRRSLGQAVRWN